MFKFMVRMRPESWPEPLIVFPPLMVCVATLTLEPFTVPIHVSTPSNMTMLVMLAALLLLVMVIVAFTPGQENVPLNTPTNFARISVPQVLPSKPAAQAQLPSLHVPPFKQVTSSQGSSFLQPVNAMLAVRPMINER